MMMWREISLGLETQQYNTVSGYIKTIYSKSNPSMESEQRAAVNILYFLFIIYFCCSYTFLQAISNLHLSLEFITKLSLNLSKQLLSLIVAIFFISEN